MTPKRFSTLILVCGALCAGPRQLQASPLTTTQVSVRADNVCVADPALTPGCISAAGASSASVSQDGATSAWLIRSSAISGASSSHNQGTIALEQDAIFGQATTGWNLSMDYGLDVFANGQWTSIIDESISVTGMNLFDGVDEMLAGHFDFADGASYEIRSRLSVGGTGGQGVVTAAEATSVSTWTDVFTFSNGGGGSVGADFHTSLKALFSSESFFLASGLASCGPGASPDNVFCGPTYVNRARIDAPGATLTGIDVGQGVRVGTSSGTTYPVRVPEPATAELLLVCAGFVVAVKSRALGAFGALGARRL